MSLKAVTANRLRQGDVVYLTDRGQWSKHLNESRISSDKAEQDAMLAHAEADVGARKIVGPYLMDVVEVDGILHPLSTRETIRAAGPTVRADFRGLQPSSTKQSPPSQSPRAA